MTQDQRQALVTGGANGIGRGIALRLLQEGWRVLAVDTDAEGLEGLGRHEALATARVDVSDEADVRRAVDGLGRLDLLVSNAGIASPVSGPIEDLALADWNAWIGTNLTGTFLMAKHCVPLLRAAGGSIIAMSSTRSQMAEPDTEAYCASKGGIEALVQALAVSLGPQVRANAIAPGWIATGDREALRPVDHDQHPAGRVGAPRDIADAVVWLADAGFVTGQTLVIDGGMTRKMIYAH